MPYKFMGSTSAAHKRNIPYGVMVGHLQRDPRDSGRYVPLVSIQDFASSVVNVHADNSGIYQNTGACDLGALFRPFSVVTNPSGYNFYVKNDYISNLPRYRAPHYQLASGSYPVSGIYTPPALSSYTMTPFINGNSYEWMTYGNTYSGIHLRKNPAHDMSTARSMGLNHPINVVGYGVDLQGYPIPNIVPGEPLYAECSGYYATNTLKDPSQHVAGPLDLMYDRIRGMWCAPGMTLFGILAEDLVAGYAARASGAMMILLTENSNFDTIEMKKNPNSALTWRLRVFSYGSTSVLQNTNVGASYNALTNKWMVIWADCPG